MVVDGQTVVRSLFDRVIFIIRRKNLNSPEYRITAVDIVDTLYRLGHSDLIALPGIILREEVPGFQLAVFPGVHVIIFVIRIVDRTRSDNSHRLDERTERGNEIDC